MGHPPNLCKEIICKNCKELFKQRRWWQEFCSSKCRNIYWNEHYSNQGIHHIKKDSSSESEK